LPASQGILPQLVGGAELQQANALLRLGLNACQIVGPAIGGALVAATAPGWALAVDAVSFALGAVFVAGLRLPGGVRSGTSMLSELHDGWREFKARTWLWAIVLQFSLVNAAAAGVTQVLGPVQAEQHLGGAGPYGLILAFGAAGYVGGGIVMLRFRPERILLVATLGVFAEVPLLALWGIPAPVAVLAAANFVLGLGIETFGVLWDTAMQQQIPGEKLSRLYAYDMLGSIALMPLGLAVVGPVAGAVGVQETCWGAAALVAVATLAVLLSRDVRGLRRQPR
jgi:MFS family permease